jgi:hypothetical protein
LGNPRGRAKNPINLLVTAAILPENIPWEHYLCKAVLITQSSSPVCQYGNYSTLVGWVVMRAGVYVEVGMGRFTAHFIAKRAIRSPVNICIQEVEVADSFIIN